MGVPEAISLTLTLLALFAALSAASWARTAVKESQRLRDEVLTAIGSMRGDIALRNAALAAPAGALASTVVVPSPVKVPPLETGAETSSTDEEHLDIPAALVGARYKEVLERIAPALGTTPVNLLRSALDAGLTGGRPITADMLDMLDELVKEGDPPPPSEPGPSRTN